MGKTKIFLSLVSFLAFAGFVFFSYLVSQEIFTQIDFDTTVRIQNKIPLKLDPFLTVFSLIGSLEITGLIWFLILIYTLIKRQYLTFFALFLFPVGLLFELASKILIYHPSPPFMFFRGIHFFLPSSYVTTDYSYFSGHTFRTTFLVTFFGLFVYFRYSSFKKFLFILALIAILLIVYLSRISLGEHWTTDVVGGGLIGSSLGILASLTIRSSHKG